MQALVIDQPRFLSPRALPSGSLPRAFPATSYATSYASTSYLAPPQVTYAQPTYAQPSYAQSSYAQSYAQPSYAQPSYAQPSYEQPTYTVAGAPAPSITYATYTPAPAPTSAPAAAPSTAVTASASASSSHAGTTSVVPLSQSLSGWPYASVALQSIDNLRHASLHAEADGWRFNHETDTHIRVFTRENEDKSARAVCGQAIVKASAARVIAEASNTANWSKWDPLLASAEHVTLQPTGPDGRPLSLDAHTKFRVYRMRFNKVFPYGARDICFLETETQLEDGTMVLASKGIDYAAYPASKDFVRANLKGGGWFARPISDNECMVTYYMNMDPMLAMVPKWALEKASTRFPVIIDKLRAGIPGAR